MKLSAIKSSDLIKNIFAVALGTAGAQVITFAFSPLITRIYSPEIFGLQGLFLSLVYVIAPIITLRLPLAIVTAKSDSEALSLKQLSLWVALILSGLLMIALLMGGSDMNRLLGAEDLKGWILLLPLALLSVAYQESHDYHAARHGTFRLVGGVEALWAFLTNLSRVAFGLVMPIAATLICITSLAPALKAALLQIRAKPLRLFGPPITFDQAKQLLATYKDFPLLRGPTDMLSAASQALPVVMLTALFTPAAAGFYVLARSVINLPLNIIGTSVGNVIYARLADLDRDGKPLFPLVLKSTLTQLALPGAGLALGTALLPFIFSLVFGKTWTTAGEYAQWMALWIIGMLVNIPGVRALPVIGKQSWHLFFNILIFVSGGLGLYAGYSLGQSAISAVQCYSLVTALMYAIQIIVYLYLVRQYDTRRV